MKLAEALAERADVQRRLDDLAQRVVKVARVQEGDQPDENPQALTEEVERLLVRLDELVRLINKTNAATPFDASASIADAIAQRDVLGRRQRYFAALADAASARNDRYTRSEIKFVATVDVPAVRAAADEAAQRYRALDTKLQQLNWNTELLER